MNELSYYSDGPDNYENCTHHHSHYIIGNKIYKYIGHEEFEGYELVAYCASCNKRLNNVNFKIEYSNVRC